MTVMSLGRNLAQGLAQGLSRTMAINELQVGALAQRLRPSMFCLNPAHLALRNLSQEANAESNEINSDRVSIGMRGDGTSPRFYQQVSVAEDPEGQGFRVLLDGNLLNTPGKQPLVLPSKDLAMAIAAEWEWQVERSIRPFTMPLMTLAATAIDRVPVRADLIIKDMLKCFPTDAACCRFEPGDPIAVKQAEVFDPMVEYASECLGAKILVTDSIFGTEQSQETTLAMEKFLRSLSDYELAAIDSMASAVKSTIIAISVMHGKVSIEDGVKASRLEEDFQIDKWGLVEGGHDIDHADVTVRVAAPAVFLQLAAMR